MTRSKTNDVGSFIITFKMISRNRKVLFFVFLASFLSSTIVGISIESIDIGKVKIMEDYYESYKPHIVVLLPLQSNESYQLFLEKQNISQMVIGGLGVEKISPAVIGSVVKDGFTQAYLLVINEGDWHRLGIPGEPPFTITFEKGLLESLRPLLKENFGFLNDTLFMPLTPGLYGIVSKLSGGISVSIQNIRFSLFPPLIITTPEYLSFFSMFLGFNNMKIQLQYKAWLVVFDNNSVFSILGKNVDMNSFFTSFNQLFLQNENIHGSIRIINNLETYDEVRSQSIVISSILSSFSIIPILIVTAMLITVVSLLLRSTLEKWETIMAARGWILDKQLFNITFTFIIYGIIGGIVGVFFAYISTRILFNIPLSYYGLNLFLLLGIPLGVAIVSSLRSFLVFRTKNHKSLYEWTPSTALKILVFLSIISIIIVLSGITLQDVVEISRKIENTAVIMFISISLLTAVMLAPIAPIVLVYFLIMHFSGSRPLFVLWGYFIKGIWGERVFLLFNGLVRTLGRELRFILFMIGFSMSTIIYIIIVSNSVPLWLTNLLSSTIGKGNLAPVSLILSLLGVREALNHSFYWSIPISVVGVIGIAGIIMFYSLVSATRSNRWSAILVSRGADIRMLRKVLFSLPFPAILMIMLIGPIGGLFWAKVLSSYFVMVSSLITLGQKISAPLQIDVITIITLVLSLIILYVITYYWIAQKPVRPQFTPYIMSMEEY